MSAKHTPGPWTASWSAYDEGRYVVKAGQPTNRVLARFDGDGDGPDEQSIADAHLIAAAPDMLTALIECIHIIERHTFKDCDRARAAVAKARREE